MSGSLVFAPPGLRCRSLWCLLPQASTGFGLRCEATNASMLGILLHIAGRAAAADQDLHRYEGAFGQVRATSLDLQLTDPLDVLSRNGWPDHLPS